MEQEVYVDLYFLINTSMNLLTLMISASLLHRKISRWRACLAASVGGLWAVVALFWGMEGFWGLVLDCTVIFLMCAVVFATPKASFRALLKCTLVGMLTSAILGGIMTALYALFNRFDLPMGESSQDGSSLLVFAIIATLAGFATVTGGRFLGFSKKSKYITVTAVLFGKTVTLRALVDTGNRLREPMSGRSVIVADKARILEALPQSLAEALTSTSPEEWLSDARYATRIRIIPTNTATGTKMLPAILPDKLTVCDGKESYPADHLIAPAPMQSGSGFDAVISIH